MDIWKIVDDHLMRAPAIHVDRLPTFYPSSASCINEEDGTSPIGACLRMNYYRCLGYEKSDKDSVWSQYVFAGGNIWEDWVTEQLKQAGPWLANSVKFVDTQRYISGEIDIIVQDPDDFSKHIVEVKTFYGYEAKKRIVGNSKVKPSPKDPNLLQAMIYNDQFSDQIDGTCLVYFARDDHSRQQFNIKLVEIDGRRYPEISTKWRGSNYKYVDKRISIEGIYERYETLLEHLQKKELPPADYKHNYTKEEIEQMYEAGDLSKTAYTNYQSNPEKNPCGYFMCQKYCGYRTQCAQDKAELGEM